MFIRQDRHPETISRRAQIMNFNILEHIRRACKEVTSQASHVHIDREKIPSYAASLPLERIKSPQLDPEHHYLDHGEDTLAYLLTLNTVNFGSGYFPHLRKRPGLSGYFTIATSLKDCFEKRGALSAQELSRLTLQDCMEIFGQDPDNGPRSELMGLFAKALNDLGYYVLDRYEGRFANLIESAEFSAARLVGILAQMPYFRDIESYRGFQVPFYKRAQITAADLSLAFGKQGYGRFDDLDDLTMFADNLVPHVLRVDGVLFYEETLASRIDAEELVPSGSEEEIEIRASALHVVELLSQELNESGHNVTPMKLDYLLWNRGQQPYYKARPRHRSRTVFY